MPKVSVIILTYNRAHFIPSAIKSVLNQTFQDFEIIVVDDASKDNTWEVVSGFHDHRIRYIRHETNQGEAAGRNTGVMSASGQFVAFLDDDDEWMPEKLQMQIDVLEDSPPEVGCVYTGCLGIGKTGGILDITVPKKRGDLFQELLMGSFITTSSLLLRRICFEKVGLFDEGISYGNDFDMWLRISKHFQFECIRAPLVKYHSHDNNISSNLELVIGGWEALLKKHAKLLASNSREHSHRYLDLGEVYCLAGNVRKGRETILKAIKLYPFEVRHYYNFCLSLLGVNNFRKFKEAKEKLTSRIRESYYSLLLR